MKLFYSKPVRFIVIICVFLLGVDNLSDMFVDISRPVFYGGLAALLAAAVGAGPAAGRALRRGRAAELRRRGRGAAPATEGQRSAGRPPPGGDGPAHLRHRCADPA